MQCDQVLSALATSASRGECTDPCNTIKCALTCEAECGWSRPLGRCVAGLSTEASEIKDRLGDCPTGVQQTVDTVESPPRTDTNTSLLGGGGGGGGGGSGGSGTQVAFSVVGSFLLLLCILAAKWRSGKQAEAQQGEGTFA